MRRFSVLIIALAAVAVLWGSSGKDRAEEGGVAKPRAVLAATGSRTLLSGREIIPLIAADPDAVKREVAASSDANPVKVVPADGAGLARNGAAALSAASSSGDVMATASANPELIGGDLIVATQKQLERLGCYTGPIDGHWGAKSRAAMADFEGRVGLGSSDEPDNGLLAALRKAPPGLCRMNCSGQTGGGECAVVSANVDSQTVPDNRDLTYLPPWMRGEKLANTNPDAQASQDAQDAAPKTPKVTQFRAEADRRWKVYRVDPEQRYPNYERQLSRNRNWVPNGWPGAAY